jgi:hypothetical protein
MDEPTKEPPKKFKIPKLVRFQGDLVEEVLRIPAKSSFKRLILETLLWSYSMSSNLKSPLEGLKASECEKGKLGLQPPIPYVLPTNLIKKREGEQIKVKMPDGTNSSMAAFTSSTNKDYLVHIIAVLCIIKKIGNGGRDQGSLAGNHCRQEGNGALFPVPADESKEAKTLCLASLNQFKDILKAKKVTAIAVTGQAYEMFRLFVLGDQQTQWDKIVQEMHTKDPWIGVNGVSHKGICISSWPAFFGLHQASQADHFSGGRR